MVDTTSTSIEYPRPEQRIYLKVANIAYILPNDAPEHVRLETQAAHLSAIMSHKVIHSPVSDPKRILDVGCGTGIVTTALAQQFPNAQVFGIDLAPVPQIEGRATPSNVTYVQGNIMDLDTSPIVEEDNIGAPWDAGRRVVMQSNFDLIYSRLLVCGMSDWPGYIRKASTVVRPGGWIEAHDLYLEWFDEADNIISSSWKWNKILREAASERGLDWHCGLKTAGRMKDIGLVDVDTTVYRWPIGGEGEESEELKAFGKFLADELPRMFTHVISKTTERNGYSQEKIEEIRGDMRESLKPEKGKHMKFFVTRGRRPE